MWKPAATGSALFGAGAIRFSEHLNRVPTLDDYLAFRCGLSGAAQDGSALGHMLTSAGHCWGCYSMAAGAALVAVSAWRWARKPASVARPRR
jgi:hypothetical protein